MQLRNIFNLQKQLHCLHSCISIMEANTRQIRTQQAINWHELYTAPTFLISLRMVKIDTDGPWCWGYRRKALFILQIYFQIPLEKASFAISMFMPLSSWCSTVISHASLPGTVSSINIKSLTNYTYMIYYLHSKIDGIVECVQLNFSCRQIIQLWLLICIKGLPWQVKWNTNRFFMKYFHSSVCF